MNKEIKLSFAYSPNQDSWFAIGGRMTTWELVCPMRGAHVQFVRCVVLILYNSEYQILPIVSFQDLLACYVLWKQINHSWKFEAKISIRREFINILTIEVINLNRKVLYAHPLVYYSVLYLSTYPRRSALLLLINFYNNHRLLVYWFFSKHLEFPSLNFGFRIHYCRPDGSVGQSVSSRQLGHLPGGCRFESHHGPSKQTER